MFIFHLSGSPFQSSKGFISGIVSVVISLPSAMAMLLRRPLPENCTSTNYFPADLNSTTSGLVPICGKRPLRLVVRGPRLQDDHLSKKQKTGCSKIDQQHDLLAARKLSLVLDLDHTLLHTVSSSKLRPSQQECMRKEEQKDIASQRRLFCLPHLQAWTRLRPGIWTFLEKASQLFELHICTMGGQQYAQEMAKLLDPTGALFGGRVLSKREAKPKVKDLDDVLGTESTAVIIDDTVEVWPRNKANLIRAECYSMKKDGEDRFLTSLYTVIERIHRDFFSSPVLDVRTIIAAEQGKVLAGCCLHISKEFQTPEAEPYLDSLYETAQRFGAKCTTRQDDLITHVLSNSLTTEEAKWGLSTGKFVVNPKWIETSALLYQKADGKDFLPSGFRLKVLLRQPFFIF